ncbi:hypothetical protein M422DRAFT_186794, partial [Sphaerobolus stellatus SS14]
SGLISISCIRSGAFCINETVDLAKGERFVNFDFALCKVLKNIISSGLKQVVISYDVACKFHIHFNKCIRHQDWRLLSEDELERLEQIEIVWLVPKFHLAAHIEGCADRFSFNWTKLVGRTCGETVESNWARLNGLATSTREMGFGQRRDVLTDSMCFHNFNKAVNEGTHWCFILS